MDLTPSLQSLSDIIRMIMEVIMSRIFISHSSHDNFEAIALSLWLKAEGWDDFFLDLDPERGIVAGDRWERKLVVAANRCEAVIFLISRKWLASPWCLREFQLADKLNKRLFGVIIDDVGLPDLPAQLTRDWQVNNLFTGKDHQIFRATTPDGASERNITFSGSGLVKLKNGLKQVGLDPAFFPWPPTRDRERKPYRGLPALDVEDSGIFFGRDAAILSALDQLRGLRDAAPPRLMAIVGASGAGKSSFLRAGIVARLERDDRHFYPLQVVRPERAVLSGAAGFVASILKAAKKTNLGLTRADVVAASVSAATLGPLLHNIAHARSTEVFPGETDARAPTLVLPVDQFEELFLTDGAEEAAVFMRVLADVLAADNPPLICLLSIRSDKFEQLQLHPALEQIQPATFSLQAMPRSAYERVINGPVERMNESGRSFIIQPALTDALLEDINRDGGKDALPLLAFTLERMFSEYGDDGNLTLGEYQKSGGFRGSIGAAMELVISQIDPSGTLPAEPKARLALLRNAMIPWLVQIDPDSRIAQRRVARRDELPSEALPLIDQLVEMRLLTTDTSQGLPTVEVAHEALFRHWKQLEAWLEEDFEALSMVQGVKRSAAEYNDNDMAKDWLAHGGERLTEAEALCKRPDLRRYAGEVSIKYLAACRARESKYAQNRRVLKGAVFVSVLIAVAIGLVAAFWKLSIEATAANEKIKAQIRLTEIQIAATREQKKLTEAADRAKLEATDQARIADVRSMEAERERSIASEQRIKAEQRAALLSAGAVRDLANDGRIDEALLLGLDAAKAFDDASAPDQILIAMDQALTKRARTSTVRLTPGLKVFETEKALYIFEPSTGHLYSIADHWEPKLIRKGTPTEAPIIALVAQRTAGQIMIARKGGALEMLSTATGEVLKSGRFAVPKAVAGRVYDEDTLKLTDASELTLLDNGMAVRNLRYQVPKGEGGWLVQIKHHMSGLSLEQPAPTKDDVWSRWRTTSDNEAYYYGMHEKRVYRVVLQGSRLSLQSMEATEPLSRQLAYGECAKHVDKRGGVVLKELKAFFRENRAGAACHAFEDRLLVTINKEGMGGTTLVARIIGLEEYVESIGAAATLDQPGQEGVDNNNVKWVRYSPESGALTLIAGRVLVSGEGDDTIRTERYVYKHPDNMGHARLIKSDVIVTVSEDSGIVTGHRTSKESWIRYFSDESDFRRYIVLKETINPLVAGNCLIGSKPDPEDRIIDDLDNKVKYKIHETGFIIIERSIIIDNNNIQTKITIPKDTICVSFYLNPPRVLLLYGNDPQKIGISMQNFARIIQQRAFTLSELERLPIASLIDAAPIPNSDDILVAHSLNRISRFQKRGDAWTQREVFRSENEIVGLSSDKTGKRILIKEHVGDSQFKVSLVSLPARLSWFDFGITIAYDVLAYWTDDERIAVVRGDGTKTLHKLPVLSEVVAMARKALLPHCQPPEADRMRSSPCWPQGFD